MLPNTNVLNLSYYRMYDTLGLYQNQKHTLGSIKDINLKDLHPYFNLWKKINQGQDFVRIDSFELSKNRPNESTIETFVAEEFSTGVTVIQSIHRTFAHLNKVIKSGLELDENNQVLVRQIIQSKVCSKLYFINSTLKKYIYRPLMFG